jgi:nucleotide-binding universal stress UspA family protein
MTTRLVRAVRPVVAGVDGSDDSLTALRWAADEARRRSAPLWVVHAVDLVPPEYFNLEDPGRVAAQRHTAEEVLEAAVRQAGELAGDVEVRPVLETGAATLVLLKQSALADLVVLGSRGRGGFTGLLLGSTSLQVAMHAPCPVVVIRTAADVAPGPSAGRIVVGADGSPHSELALGFAFEQAQERSAGVTAVRAWLSPSVYVNATPADQRKQAEQVEQAALTESLAPWRQQYPGVDVLERAVFSEPIAKMLIDESAGAELLVVGSHGRGGFGGLVLGSVSHAALHHAHCPVAVVRH